MKAPDISSDLQNPIEIPNCVLKTDLKINVERRPNLVVCNHLKTLPLKLWFPGRVASIGFVERIIGVYSPRL
jgi:hypothetical protein